MTDQPTGPTVKSVITHAEKMRSDAEAFTRTKDVYASPPYPTTASARSQFNRELTALRQERGIDADMEGGDDPELQHEAARRAIAWMDRRWVLWLREYREHEESADLQRRRHRYHQKVASQQRDDARQGLTPGQRIDQALALLSAVSNAPVAAMDADRVSGSGGADGPAQLASATRFPGDAAGRARHLVIECVRAVEQEAEEAKRRMVEVERAG